MSDVPSLTPFTALAVLRLLEKENVHEFIDDADTRYWLDGPQMSPQDEWFPCADMDGISYVPVGEGPITEKTVWYEISPADFGQHVKGE